MIWSVASLVLMRQVSGQSFVIFLKNYEIWNIDQIVFEPEEKQHFKSRKLVKMVSLIHNLPSNMYGNDLEAKMAEQM